MLPIAIKFVGDLVATIALLMVLHMRADAAPYVVVGIAGVWGARTIGNSIEKGAKIRGGTGLPGNVIPPEVVPESIPPSMTNNGPAPEGPSPSSSPAPPPKKPPSLPSAVTINLPQATPGMYTTTTFTHPPPKKKKAK